TGLVSRRRRLEATDRLDLRKALAPRGRLDTGKERGAGLRDASAQHNQRQVQHVQDARHGRPERAAGLAQGLDEARLRRVLEPREAARLDSEPRLDRGSRGEEVYAAAPPAP